MTDPFNFKKGVLDEDYFSDEELREAFINPTKHVVLKKEAKTYQIVQEDFGYNQNLDYTEIDDEDERINSLLKLHDDLTTYTRDNSLLILDKLSVKDMRYFLKE